MEILKLREHSELASEAATWFHSKWDIPAEEYAESIQECLAGKVLSRSGMLSSRMNRSLAVLGSSKTISITVRI